MSSGETLAGIQRSKEPTTSASRTSGHPLSTSGDVGPGAAVRRLRLGDDQAQPGPLPCRAQGHFFGYPLKRKNDPPRSNAAAMGLANRWLGFLHKFNNYQRWEKDNEIPSAS